jgi:hypothetical protein
VFSASARGPAEDSSPAKVPGAFIGLFLVTALVGIVGLIGIFGTITNLRFMGLPPDHIKQVLALILVFSSVAVLGVVALLSFVLLRIFGISAKPAPLPQSGQARQLEHPPAQIQAPPMMQSVTEHTTRNFESSLYREPGTRE